jgi:hypothetical protein
MIKEELVLLYKSEINDKAIEIDPNNEYDWFSLTMGWALAKGLSPIKALKFSSYIRYETELG